MLPENDSSNGHEVFKELSALSNAGMLTATEWTELNEHLSLCEECREIHNEYLLLDRQGMVMLAATFARPESKDGWDNSATREKLAARVQAAEQSELWRRGVPPADPSIAIWQRVAGSVLTRLTVAACFIVAVALTGYHLGHRGTDSLKQQASAEQTRLELIAVQKNAVARQLDTQAGKIAQLEAEASEGKVEVAEREQEVTALRSAFQEQNQRLGQLTASRSATEDQLRVALQQRDALGVRLQAAEQDYESARAEVASLRAERDRVVLRTASLESKIDELSAANRDQAHRLTNQDQYLISDRDIRELMGARQLYIADVYDIDSSSRTRKPFGRVFYTQGRSLIFYAFDLDGGPKVKNASANAFQVWGRKTTDEGKPFNLGILYEDSAANRRWVLRSDDPQQLAEINSVFVTIEPNGGSRKPTGKPFLFALLRKEVNHP